VLAERATASESHAATLECRAKAAEPQVAALECRTTALEHHAVTLDIRAAAAECQAGKRDKPLYWLKRNWLVVLGIIAVNATISGLLIYFLR
jgi:hypothetical protein